MKRIALAAIIASAGLWPAWAGADGSCYSYVRSDAQRRLVHRESRGNPHAKNPRSSAFGCGQLTTGNRVRFGRRLGIAPNTRSPALQMRLMHAYVDSRYGNDERALAHSLARGWY